MNFDNLRACCLATDKESPRYALNYIKAIDGKIVGVDGKIMAVADNVYNMRDGLYKIVQCTKSKIFLSKLDEEAAGRLTFPDYKRIMPDKDTPAAAVKILHNNQPQTFIVARLAMLGVAIDYKLLKPIEGLQVDFEIRGHDKPVYFSREGLEGVIMPLHLDNGETFKAMVTDGAIDTVWLPRK